MAVSDLTQELQKDTYKPPTASDVEEKIHEVVLIALVDIFQRLPRFGDSSVADAFEKIDERGEQKDAADFVRKDRADGEDVRTARR